MALLPLPVTSYSDLRAISFLRSFASDSCQGAAILDSSRQVTWKFETLRKYRDFYF